MRFDRRLWLLAVPLLLLASAAEAAKPRDTFVEFGGRRTDLGRTVLLVDVVVVDDIAGTVEKVKLGRSMSLAREAALGMARGLAEHGVPVDTALVATIGATLSPLQAFQTDSIEARGQADTARTVRAPFYADAAFAEREALELWRRAVSASLAYSRKKNKPPGFVQETIDLGTRLGCDAVAMLVGVSWGVPTTKKLLAALGGTAVSSKTTVWLFISDARSGEVLWKQVEVFPSATGEEFATALERFAKELP
jgi:hypothetical protein